MGGMIQARDEEAFIKNFRKSFFSSAKDTSSCAKIFWKCFFFTETKLFIVEMFFFAKVLIFFFIKFYFIATTTFLDSGIVGLTENVKHVMICCVDQSENTFYTWQIWKFTMDRALNRLELMIDFIDYDRLVLID